MQEVFLEILNSRITLTASIFGVLIAPTVLVFNYLRIKKLKFELENQQEIHSLETEKLRLEIQALKEQSKGNLFTHTNVRQASLDEILRFGNKGTRQGWRGHSESRSDMDLSSLGPLGILLLLILPIVLFFLALPPVLRATAIALAVVLLILVAAYKLYLQGTLLVAVITLVVAAAGVAGIVSASLRPRPKLRIEMIHIGPLTLALVDRQLVQVLRSISRKTVALQHAMAAIAFPLTFELAGTILAWTSRPLSLGPHLATALALGYFVAGSISWGMAELLQVD